MALYPNAYYMTRSTYKGIGTGVGLSAINKNKGDRMNRYTGTVSQLASTPDGYDIRAFVPPIDAGSISSLTTITTVGSGGTALIRGGPIAGTATITFDQAGSLSLTVGLSASEAVVTFTGNNMVLRLTVGLDGTGEFSLTGTNNLALIVPFEGAGTVVTFGAGATDLRGLLSMQGEWSPFTELSPENLAAAVWNALLAQYDDDGTMGKAMSLASSGSVDYAALAAAVLAAAQVTPIYADTRQMNGATVTGTGTSGDLWRGV